MNRGDIIELVPGELPACSSLLTWPAGQRFIVIDLTHYGAAVAVALDYGTSVQTCIVQAQAAKVVLRASYENLERVPDELGHYVDRFGDVWIEVEQNSFLIKRLADLGFNPKYGCTLDEILTYETRQAVHRR